MATDYMAGVFPATCEASDACKNKPKILCVSCSKSVCAEHGKEAIIASILETRPGLPVLGHCNRCLTK
jgi:hypothetical protein